MIHGNEILCTLEMKTMTNLSNDFVKCSDIEQMKRVKSSVKLYSSQEEQIKWYLCFESSEKGAIESGWTNKWTYPTVYGVRTIKWLNFSR